MKSGPRLFFVPFGVSKKESLMQAAVRCPHRLWIKIL
tara:strand:+ start:10 stop:120 length:111 start_codon:yes stop_codon:yes gene_type:complete